MDQESIDILREAVQTRQRKEELERSIGRAVRRNNLAFKIYIQIIDDLRAIARKKDISIESAAIEFLAEDKDKAEK